MRVVFSIIGAVLGLSLASGSHELLGVVLGGFAGFGIAELGALRVKLNQLEGELAALRKLAASQPGRATESQQRTAGENSTAEPASGWSAAGSGSGSCVSWPKAKRQNPTNAMRRMTLVLR